MWRRGTWQFQIFPNENSKTWKRPEKGWVRRSCHRYLPVSKVSRSWQEEWGHRVRVWTGSESAHWKAHGQHPQISNIAGAHCPLKLLIILIPILKVPLVLPLCKPPSLLPGVGTLCVGLWKERGTETGLIFHFLIHLFRVTGTGSWQPSLHGNCVSWALPPAPSSFCFSCNWAAS